MNRFRAASGRLLLLLALTCLPACQATGGDPGEAKPETRASIAPPKPLDPATILARVNGREIPARELEQTVRIYLEANAPDPGAVPPEQLRAIRKQMLDSLISSEVLYQASEGAGIRVAEKDVEEQMASLRGRFASEQEFLEYVAKERMNVDEMKGRIRKNLATTHLVEKEVEAKLPKVTEREIAEYFEKNRDRMRREETAHVYEIVVRVDPRGGADAKATARRKIESILKELQAGKDFSDLARRHSETPSASRGGDIGTVTRTGTLPALANAAFALKSGEFSDVVESPLGYHLLKVTEKRAAGDIRLEEARPQIENVLRQQKEREAFQAYVARLRAGAKVEILVPDP
jgi:peptidyl-prolyl cis-trans isomerase C